MSEQSNGNGLKKFVITNMVALFGMGFAAVWWAASSDGKDVRQDDRMESIELRQDRDATQVTKALDEFKDEIKQEIRDLRWLIERRNRDRDGSPR